MKTKFYLCGGAVRDKVLGKNPKDLDFVVLADSFDEMREAILNRGGKIFVEKPEYQVIRGFLPDVGASDFALPRKDGDYSDGRRPDTTEVADSLFEDSCRRDFTINAMFQDLDSEDIIDFHNGIEDLEKQKINCVGNAEDRFEEDSLRMLRALRFSITKGFKISGAIKDCFITDKYIDLLENVSAERVREEMLKCFKFDTNKTFDILEYFPLLRRKVFEKVWLKPSMEK